MKSRPIIIALTIFLFALCSSACSWEMVVMPTPATGPLLNGAPDDPAEPNPTVAWHKGQIRDPTTACVSDISSPTPFSLYSEALTALALWREAIPNLPLAISGRCEGHPVNGDGVNVIGWEVMPGSVAGQARVVTSDDAVTEFDIAIDSSDPTIQNEDCILRDLVHEMGHVLGLGHSRDPGSVMYPELDCSVPLIPQIDVLAARALYP